MFTIFVDEIYCIFPAGWENLMKIGILIKLNLKVENHSSEIFIKNLNLGQKCQ